jgi:hypothetical protein
LDIDFEKKHFQQSCYWVGGFSFNIMRSELILSLIADPETDIIEGTIEFQEITNYSGEFEIEEFDPECTENLIGISATENSGKTTYIVNFGIGDIIFTTTREPEVKWNDPNKRRTYRPSEEKIRIET